jgi:Ca2+-binding EF-hand superfamily protein
LFQVFDGKQDGKIDFDEFMAFLKKHPEYIVLFGDPNIAYASEGLE